MGYSKKVTRGCIRPFYHLSLFCLLGLFLLFPGTPALSGTIDLPQTGQTTCYNTAGTKINCDDTGQDGDFLAGVAWPASRFELDSFGDCITDNLTGLMWSRNAYAPSLVWDIWGRAVGFLPTLATLCGYGDWRLPNVNELQSLINAEQADNTLWLSDQGFRFRTDISPIYWSSTSSADNPFVNAWDVNMIDGSIISESKGFTRLIWPVRGTSNPLTNIPPGQIPETGQIASVANYDDAYFVITPGLNVGVPWPDPRFTVTYCEATGPCTTQDTDCDADPSNDIVTDNLTGLVWLADANLDGLKTWGNALSYANALATCGYADWRLPNSKELFSLVDRSQTAPALFAGHPFINIQYGIDDLYWSSTSYASDPDMAWTLDMLLGNLSPFLKSPSTQLAFVWPVRGGKTEPYVLTVKKLGNGQGTVTADGLSCAVKTCRGEYQSYEAVTVTAAPQPGSVFTGWGGDACSGVTDATCTITVTANMNVTATFRSEVKISVFPKSLNFKNLKQNIESTPLSVTITNLGVANLDLSTPAVIAEDPTSVFAIFSNDCPAALASDASCTIAVTATSPDYDTKTAKLRISSNDPKKPLTIVRLKARAKPPKITRKPGGLNFGKVTVGIPFDKTLTITNKGITDLTIGAITTSGDHPGDFAIVLPDTCSGSTLVTDGTCTLTVTFTPSVVGKRSAILQIPSNDPKKSTLLVKLSGVGQ